MILIKMSYRNQQNGNVTMIEDLPDIEELDNNSQQMELNGLNMIPASESSKFQKFIRNNNNHNFHESSGMNNNRMIQSYNPYKVGYNNNMNQGSYIDSINVPNYQYPNVNQPFYEPYENVKMNPTNCLDVADHATNCPVCSKLYNNDKTVYIITIVILSIICILLLKRILDL